MTKILLVEDDKSLREIYGVRLQAEGYEIISAGDGEEALAVAIKERPDLIISDVMMPKISGFDMLDILRSTTETRDIRIIMMTALSSDDQRQRGEELGADRYLVKSQVGIEDVVRTVHDILADVPTTVKPEDVFKSPAPSAVATAPAAPAVAPVAPPALAPAVTAPTPTVPVTPVVAPAPVVPPADQPAAATPAPAANPTVIPVTEPAASTPTATPAPTSETTMPQPTAPFSTPRPATLGDRIIHPLASTDTDADKNGSIADRIAEELNQASDAPASPETPAAP